MNKTRLNDAVVSIILMLFFSFFLVSCGSSGDGTAGGTGGTQPAPTEPGGLPFTGITTAATITDTNAPIFAANILKGQTGGALPVSLGAVTVETESNQGAPFGYWLSKVLRDLISESELSGENDGVFVGAEIRTSTVPGSCGGTADVTIEVPELSDVDYTGTITFSSFCERGIILNGSGDISGQIDEPEVYDIRTIGFLSPDLNAMIDGVSYTIDGEFFIDYNTNRAEFPEYALYYNYRFQEDSIGDVYWCKNFNLDGTQESLYVINEFNIVSGRFYDPNYGYVDVTTPTPFIYQTGDDYPESGELLMEGADGVACPTAALLTALSSTECQVEADTDGDCAFDDYDSGVINWTDL